MNTIVNLWCTIRLIIVAITSGVEVALARTNLDAERARRYINGLRLLIPLAVLVPIVFVLPGVVLGWSWLTAIGGLAWGSILLVIGVWGGPLGVLIDALWSAGNMLAEEAGDLPKGFFLRRWLRWWKRLFVISLKNGAKQYVEFVRGVILYELITTLILSILPVRNNPGIVPVILLGVAVIIFATIHWKLDTGVWRKLAFTVAVATVTVGIVSLFVPLDIFGAITERARVLSGVYTKEIKAKSEEIRTNGISRASAPSTNAAVAMLMPPGDDLIIPPEATFVKVTMTTTNTYSGWIHLPNEWGWIDVWATAGGFWVQELGEDMPHWLRNNDPVVLKRGPFRVAGEGGFFFLKRKT